MKRTTNHATNLQESRVVPSQMKGEAVVNIPSAESNTEKDSFNSPWGAEKAFFFLYLLNKTARLFNAGLLEDPNIRRPIPRFETLSSFYTWVQDTNPKTVKWFMREVALNLCGSGLLNLPDDPENVSGLSDFYKELSYFMKNNVVIDYGDGV